MTVEGPVQSSPPTSRRLAPQAEFLAAVVCQQDCAGRRVALEDVADGALLVGPGVDIHGIDFVGIQAELAAEVVAARGQPGVVARVAQAGLAAARDKAAADELRI